MRLSIQGNLPKDRKDRLNGRSTRSDSRAGLHRPPFRTADRDPVRWATVLVADHTRDDSVPAIARPTSARDAPERFALAGLSMGGYVAMEVMRQAPERVSRLALLDTSARPDSVEAEPGSRAADRPRRDRPLRGDPFRCSGRGSSIPTSGRSRLLQDISLAMLRETGPDGLYPPAAGHHGPARFPAGPARHRDPDSRARWGRGCHHSAGDRPGDGGNDRMVFARRRARGGAPVDPRAAGAGDSRPSGYG